MATIMEDASWFISRSYANSDFLERIDPQPISYPVLDGCERRFPIEDTDLEMHNDHDPHVVYDIIGGWIWNVIEEFLQCILTFAVGVNESYVVLLETGRYFLLWKLCNIKVTILMKKNESEGSLKQRWTK